MGCLKIKNSTIFFLVNGMTICLKDKEYNKVDKTFIMAILLQEWKVEKEKWNGVQPIQLTKVNLLTIKWTA